MILDVTVPAYRIGYILPAVEFLWMMQFMQVIGCCFEGKSYVA